VAGGLPLLGLLLALPAGVIAAVRGFDGLYGQDAYAYFDYGAVSVRQSILHLAPLEAFYWPPGYPLLVALASMSVLNGLRRFQAFQAFLNIGVTGGGVAFFAHIGGFVTGLILALLFRPAAHAGPHPDDRT